MPNTTRDFVPPAGELACSRSGTPRAADGSASNSRVLQIMLTSIHGRQTRVTFPRWTLEQVGRSSTFVRAVLILAPLICGCSGPSSDKGEADQHVMTFDSSSARFVSHGDTVRLSLELAVGPEQRTMGLMERHHLPENAGMLFLYDSTQPPDAGYWMFRTRIPLDIAYLDSAGVVRAIREMKPCESMLAQGCPSYPPNVPYRYALEVNSGFFSRHRITIGSVAILPRPTAEASSRR